MLTIENKKEIITNILKDIDFQNDDFSINKIENDIESQIGEKVAIKIETTGQSAFNEATGETKRIKKMSSIKVFFPGSDPRSINKIELYI